MINKTINNFLSNKNFKWSINSFDSFEQYLLERFAKYYFDEKIDFEEAVNMFSDLDEYSPLDNNEDMEKINSDVGKYTYKYINSFDNYLSTTPLRVFMKEYKQGHLIYLIIKTRFKQLLLFHKKLIEEYIQWKSLNDLEMKK